MSVQDAKSSLKILVANAQLSVALQCSPQAPAVGVFAGYSCIKRRLLLVHKSKEKLCFSFARFARFVISA